MSLIENARAVVKGFRHQRRRARAARLWGLERLQALPAVVGNAMPKSGSHLISQVLLGLTAIGPFVDPGLPPITRSSANTNLKDQQILANIQAMANGDVRYGYIQARAPFIQPLTAPGRATLFVFRDPRDVLVSHVLYATEMHSRHGMHAYYTRQLDSTEARINAAIMGVTVPGTELSSIRGKYARYLPWLEQPAVLCLRFEDLILDRETAFNRILDYLETCGFTEQPPRQHALDALARAVDPTRSGTFRKAQPGNWRDHFTAENIAVFQETTGDLLQRLGYPEDW
jgi:hypothetical protein